MNKYLDTKDLRVLRTQKALRTSLLDLLQEKPFQEITVSELAKKAGINRKTFYLHYSSTKDLLDEIQEESLNQLIDIMSKYDFLSKDFYPYPLFLEFNQIIQKDSPHIKALLLMQNDGLSVVKIKKSLIYYSKERYKNRIPIDTIRFEFYLDYTIAGILALYVSWLSHKPPLVSIEELAKIACEICYRGFDEIISDLVTTTTK